MKPNAVGSDGLLQIRAGQLRMTCSALSYLWERMVRTEGNPVFFWEPGNCNLMTTESTDRVVHQPRGWRPAPKRCQVSQIGPSISTECTSHRGTELNGELRKGRLWGRPTDPTRIHAHARSPSRRAISHPPARRRQRRPTDTLRLNPVWALFLGWLWSLSL